MTLKERITEEIASQGPMTVARFMELALYDPDAGYYAAGPRRAGREWLTGPTLHPIFGATLTRGIAPLLAQLDDPTLVEIGTGGGELTRDLCYGLHEHAPEVFAELDMVLVDRSPTARERAKETLQEAGIDLADVRILEQPPEEMEAVVVHNELLDALPAHVCEGGPDGVREVHLVEGEPTLEPQLAAPSTPEVRKRAEAIQARASEHARFEIGLEAEAFTRELAARLERGAVLAIDYGAPRNELLETYPRGTIHGYRNGQRVDEFHYDPGQMDITYRVPFDEVQAAGETAGLQTHVLDHQGTVLRSLGIRAVARAGDGRDVLAAKKLIDPAGAGSTFQVLLQARGLEVGEPWPT